MTVWKSSDNTGSYCDNVFTLLTLADTPVESNVRVRDWVRLQFVVCMVGIECLKHT